MSPQASPPAKPQVAIIGYGYVGRGMRKIFPDAVLYDPGQGLTGPLNQLPDVQLAIVCVPTPRNLTTGRCDTDIVEQAVKDLPATIPYILIKSTVEPGTTHRLATQYDRAICFSPEYMGEGGYWQPPEFPSPTDPTTHGFMVIGGATDHCNAMIDIFMPRLGANTRYYAMRSREAELVKYFENAYLAMKVIFANEMRAVCDAAGVSYHAVREGWLADPRIGRSHSAAFARAPGFAGKCLPKDVSALAAYCRDLGMPQTLFDALLTANDRLQNPRVAPDATSV